MGNQNP